MSVRTDLALEQWKSHPESSLSGVSCSEYLLSPFRVTEIRITDSRGEALLGKPAGHYLTAESENDPDIFLCAAALSSLLRPLLPADGPVLICGLGNRDMTPDALGPKALESLIVTRHLIEAMPEVFGGMRPVCAVAPGVLGNTGVETAEFILGIVQRISPKAVVAVDALAAREYNRLCRTFQISDTGIIPGSGACNPRKALNFQTLGVPVIAVGVPTVVAARALGDETLPEDLLVAPKDIDSRIARCGRILGYALDLALQGEMTAGEIEDYLQ